MKRKGFSAEETVSVVEFMTVFKHRFTTENYRKKGDVHNFPELIYSLHNDINMTVDNKEYIIKEGEMFIYSPNTFHMLTKPVNATVLIVTFVPGYEGIKKFYNKILKLDKSTKVYFIKTIEEMLENLSFSKRNGIANLSLKPGVPKIQGEILKRKFEIFLLMLEKDLSKKNSENAEKFNTDLSGVINNLENNISSNYTIPEMARLNMMSESKLKKLFREYLHTSPISYFHKMKIDYAKFLLQEKEKNITEISEELGFKSIHYFSRFFKKHVGTSPTEYVNAIDEVEYRNSIL